MKWKAKRGWIKRLKGKLNSADPKPIRQTGKWDFEYCWTPRIPAAWIQSPTAMSKVSRGKRTFVGALFWLHSISFPGPVNQYVGCGANSLSTKEQSNALITIFVVTKYFVFISCLLDNVFMLLLSKPAESFLFLKLLAVPWINFILLKHVFIHAIPDPVFMPFRA